MQKKFRIFQVAFIVLCLSVNFVNGQTDWSKDMFNPEVNFYQTQEKFKTYWEGKDIPRKKDGNSLSVGRHLWSQE